MKKIIFVVAVLVAVIGVGFKSISKENKTAAPATEIKKTNTTNYTATDVSVKEHTGWD